MTLNLILNNLESIDLSRLAYDIALNDSHIVSQRCAQFVPMTAYTKWNRSITNSQSLLNLMSIESVMPSNHLSLCHPLLLLPSVFPSIRVFSNEAVLPIRWPKDWSFSFSISPSNEFSGLISFRIDWLDLLAVQGTLKSLLQHHSSKASILLRSAFFTVQLSHPYKRLVQGELKLYEKALNSITLYKCNILLLLSTIWYHLCLLSVFI